uniref:Nuclear pore complex-like protein n=1 Tax=Geladintestivirus 5 TaxID=3233137 RepID=A0AAU8MHQ1_9CAUD
MSCKIQVNHSSVTEQLRNEIGTNEVLFQSYFSEVMSEDEFTSEFNNWCNTHLDKMFDVNNNSTAAEAVKAIKRYYNENHPDINYSSRIQNDATNVDRFGYSSVASREFAKRVTANFTLDFYHQLAHDFHEKIKGSKKAYFADAVTGRIEEIIAERLSSITNMSEDDIYEIIDEGDIAKLEELFGDNTSIQNKNLLAMYKEMIANREGFFVEVFRDSRLGDLRFESDDDMSETGTYESTDEQQEGDDNTPSDEDENKSPIDDKNNSIKELNEKLGDYNNFMTHVDMSVRSYLSSLKKLNSGISLDGHYDFDLNNDLGLPDTMNADECCAVLYSYGDFTNLKSMITSIREIAKNIPGFTAFHQMADYLEENGDFAYEIYRTFGKTVISKLETAMDGDKGKSRISNRSADKLTSLRFEYLNSAKATSILLDDISSKGIYNELYQDIESFKSIYDTSKSMSIKEAMDVADLMAINDELNKQKKDLVAKISSQLRRYYPTIEDTAIANYISNANNEDIVGNLLNLAQRLKETIDASYLTQQRYNSRKAEIGRALAFNKKLAQDKAEGIRITEEPKDMTDLYAVDYVDSATQAAAFNLANALVQYTMVKTELNSRNVHGNQSSDVINNSMITNIINTLKSQTALKNFGKYKGQSRQYDFSNIMIEHWNYKKDENGNILKDKDGNPIKDGKQPINYGLFIQNPETKELTPTPYAQRLIRARLFSGASDIITSSNVLYSEMSKGDYVATSFLNFFNVEESTEPVSDKVSIKFANYFMRIPSDAPKNFIMTAPKYSVDESRVGANNGLFRIENKVEADRKIYQQINGIATVGEEYAALEGNAIKRSFNQLIYNVTSRNINNIILQNKKAVFEENPKVGDKVNVTFDYTSKDGISTQYVLEGTLANENGRLVLQAPEFKGFVGDTKSSDVNTSLFNYFQKKLIKSGDIKRSINTSHPIYQQFRQVFVQELNDAAIAIDRFFVTKNGMVELDNDINSPTYGQPIFREGFDNTKATTRKLYAGYHVGKGQNILSIDNSGKAHLTGAVFTSDRFKITKTNKDGSVTERNYGQEILDDVVDFLYGGANGKYVQTTRSDNGVNVVLNNTQESAIEQKLTEFINDYIADTQDRMEQYEDFIPSYLMSDNNVAEFALNHHLMYINFNDLFEGDTKFYKDSQTFLKRAKEVQGSGVPYGIVDYNMDLSAPRTTIPSRLNTKTFERTIADGTKAVLNQKAYDDAIAQGMTEEEAKRVANMITQTNKFRGVTIKNTIRTSKEVAVKGKNGAKQDGAVTKKLIEALHASGMTVKDATDKARQMMSGYHNTTVNDAQSYITFEEWVRRVSARGQLEKYMPLIEAILDESKPVDAKIIAEFVQVQKNFYYDQYYNAELGVIAPRQIKNAEFVLVPRFIKGTQLEQVYNLMRDNGIDQLNTEETSKAGKANVLTLWDNEGNLTQENIDDFNANAAQATELYNYNYLYTQQETPQHLDAENKAGIQIMKKILDNIDPTSPLWETKQHFFRLYSENIKDSFAELMNEFNLETDENGNLKLDKDGNIQGLNYQLFFTRLQEEVARLGLDSNMLDYVTLDDIQVCDKSNDSPLTGASTVMPTYMSNVSTKLESIAQSLFNSRITRQKLPGFHAAQITNVGWSPMSNTVEKRSYSKNLKYHPDGKPYVEIMLPKSAFNLKYEKPDGTLKTDEELLEEIQNAKIDEVIGYRIPTEGKQSVCIMKVVGFTDDALGSTIVVPDDWVSQTGSDFDIDSVYGINYSTYIDENGIIQKKEYHKKATNTDWLRYLTKKKKDTIFNAVFKSVMKEEAEAYHNVTDKVRPIIKEVQAPYVEERKAKDSKVNGRESFINQINAVIERLNQELENTSYTKEEKANIQEFIDRCDTLATILDIEKKTLSPKKEEKVNAFIDKYKEEFNKAAKDNNITTYDDINSIPSEQRNTRDARNNEILSSMIEILSHPTALEENLSRSNFDDIIDARDQAIDKNIAKRRKARSPYNFLDQADYQEDVMSGAKLKAFSVTRDTFCSICNTVRPRLFESHQVKVVYKETDGYTLKNLKKSFENVEEIQDGIFVVTHDTFGWSKNNKNAAGKILTAYSSQTTAHILDAVKEGAIPNVNDLTFQVYKLFPDLGSDYNTGVSFIMQPGISRIVAAYNSNKSIYSRGGKNPVHAAIKSVAKELLAMDGIEVTDRMSVDTVINMLQRYNSELSLIFGAGGQKYKISLEDKEVAKLLISGSRLKERLKSEGIFEGSSPVEEKRKLLFDLGTILQYNKLSHLGNSISAYARVCNPDKFGAKQTIFSTNKVFRDIKDIIADENTAMYVPGATKNDSNKHFLEAIYPGIRGSLEDFIQSSDMNSAYPPLHYFLKYATATSIKINRTLFETQDPRFVEEIMKLTNSFSGAYARMDEKTYKDFQNYVLNYLYGNTQAVSSAITYIPGQGFMAVADSNKEDERRRIFGYGKDPDLRIQDKNGDLVEFRVKDINNPTQEEIDAFATLSPAQKITWIQGHFRESGVFKYIKTTLFNERQYRASKAGSQTIEFVEGNANIETVYNEFEKCFFNDNPLVALAALDIVKYAFAVEGFRMKRNAVNKVIRNSALYNDSNSNGTGIVKELNHFIGTIADGSIDMNMLRDRFVRSHSTIYQIETHRVEKNDKRQYDLYRMDHGIIHIEMQNADSAARELAEKYGMIYKVGEKNNYGVNKYVKLRFGKDTVLYKIVENYGEIIAYPLNTLEENETNDWSVNVQNNKYPDSSYYEEIIDEWYHPVEGSTTTSLKQIIESKKDSFASHRFVNKNRTTRSTYATTFDINTKKTVDTGGFEDVIDKVNSYFAKNPKGRLYLRSGALAKYITHTGPINGSIQTINGKEYQIVKMDFKRYNNMYIGERNKDHEIKRVDPQVKEIIEKARDAGYRVSDAFYIEPYKAPAPKDEIQEEEVEVVRHSSVTELGTNSMNAMYRRQVSEGDIEAGKALHRLHEKDIKAKDASVKMNLVDVISTSAEYVTVTTNKILNDLKYFIQDESGTYHSVNDPETINLIRNNPDERARFLKILLDARAFVRNYRMINDLDIDSEDEALRRDLNKIKDAINSLRNANIINYAEERFANEYLAKLSDNPLVQQDILSLLDGYHSAGAFDAWVNDLQETSSPLLQIITKEVMGDIRAKEMQATKRVREFKTKLNELKEAARAAGVTIDWKHIIDEDGKFVQKYNQAFTEKLEELRDAVYTAKAEHGEGSIEHLKAKFEYDKWKLNHVNQQLKDDYYQRKLELEEHMLTVFPKVYEAYNKLATRRREILSHMVNGTLEERYQEELKKVKQDIDNLTAPYFYDAATDTFTEKYSYDDPENPFTGEQKLVYNIDAAVALKAHLASMKELRDEYYTHDAKFGFDEELEKNLDTISNYEMRDASGRITTPIAELMKHDDYVKAKEWVEHNARYVMSPETQKFVNDAFKVLREGKDGRKILGLLAKRKEAYDTHGIINAMLFDDDEIAKIKEEQLANYNIREGQPYADRSLISNAPTDSTQFKATFYASMKSNGIPNQEYIRLVNEINSILAPYYETATRTLHTSEITEEDLQKLAALYDIIEDTKKTTDSTNGKTVRSYIKSNVDFVIDMEKYEEQKEYARQKGSRYLRLWQAVNERIEEDDSGNLIVVPNRRIFGYAVPKGYKADGTGDNTMVDRKKTDALDVVHNYCKTVKTEYYYKKYKEMKAKTEAEFNAWYEANHIYNPYNHTYEPIQCWTRMEIKPMSDDGEHEAAGMWIPAFNQLEIRPKDGKDKHGNPDGSSDMTNHNYRYGMSTAANYKSEGAKFDDTLTSVTHKNYSDGINYDNNAIMNSYEQQVSEFMQETLQQLAHTTSAKRYFDRGYMPSRAKRPERDAKFYAKEVAKMLGWIEGASGREAWYEDIDYANDRTPDMPMLGQLKSKDSIKIDYKKPQRSEYPDTEEGTAEYNTKLEEYNKNVKEAEEANAKIHREMLDNDWESVMEEFIEKAAHFNAVQDNKYMLFYAKQMLDKLDIYVKNEGFNDLQRDGINSSEDQNRYVTKKDTRLQEQYVNWIRRLVYNQWKKPNNHLTKYANILQSMTSAKFMMLNITGGIANVTVGETQILGEVFAKEYFGKKTWAMGMNSWRAGLPSFLADMYKDTSSSVEGAIVKFMNVVDFDENTGVVHVPDAEEYLKRARDLAFSPQAMGEHFMQNGAMFSMMHSHRLFVNHDKKANGRLSYCVMNEAEYMRDANERALQMILTDAQQAKWRKFVEYETSDANRTKEYAWFRKDLTTEFANLYLNDQQKQKFISKRQELQNKAKEEFNNDEAHPTLFSQLSLGSDGKLAFKDESILANLGDEAYQILGRFKGRVISVNKKIHGVYDRLGAAKWESYWWGGIVMQYHKHLYPGIMKRYRRQGYFNEERGTIEKGCYASIKDFLAIPLHKHKFAAKLKADNNMSDSELQAVEGMQSLIRNYVEFATHIKTNWNMLPEYERANIKRALGDLAGVFSAVCLAIALRAAAGDDDDNGLVYNLAMYECDRLASESFMYNPFGIVSEGQKLWSSPVAVQSGIEDLFHTAGFISQWIIQGEDFDPYYQTGLYVGENKLWVNLRRQIPMYHAINMIERLKRSNKYYKLGDNMLSIIPVKDIADWIKE